jgi:spondin-2
LDPVDAGTDNGFTFTAPNWATDPPGVVFRVTNTYPPHPAGSFHYPFLKRLPAIAFFQFVKVNTRSADEIYLCWCL